MKKFFNTVLILLMGLFIAFGVNEVKASTFTQDKTFIYEADIVQNLDVDLDMNIQIGQPVILDYTIVKEAEGYQLSDNLLFSTYKELNENYSQNIININLSQDNRNNANNSLKESKLYLNYSYLDKLSGQNNNFTEAVLYRRLCYIHVGNVNLYLSKMIS